MHEISAAGAAQDSVEERLAKLQRLRDGDCFLTKEYEAQRRRILQSLRGSSQPAQFRTLARTDLLPVVDGMMLRSRHAYTVGRDTVRADALTTAWSSQAAFPCGHPRRVRWSIRL